MAPLVCSPQVPTYPFYFLGMQSDPLPRGPAKREGKAGCPRPCLDSQLLGLLEKGPETDRPAPLTPTRFSPLYTSHPLFSGSGRKLDGLGSPTSQA